MHRAQEVRKQLQQMMDRFKLDIVSAGRNYNKIRKAIVSGFFFKAAKRDPQEVRNNCGTEGQMGFDFFSCLV
jgi:ATP-dependent RNA helicase DHX8/PRP22